MAASPTPLPPNASADSPAGFPRRARVPRDVPQIAGLIDQGFSGTLDFSSRQLLRQVSWIAQQGRIVWFLSTLTGGANPEEWQLGAVWDADRRVLGNVTLTRRRPEHRAWLMSNVTVHPDFRRQGIGRRLVGFALEEIRARGGRSVYLQVDESNPSAVRLYRELGFRDAGRRTTWTRLPGPAVRGGGDPAADSAYTIVQRRAGEWREEFSLWREVSPNGFTWNTPLTEGIFRPSLAKEIERGMFGDAEKHLLARRDGKLEAALYAFQRPSGWEGFLMQRGGSSGRVEEALWRAAWKGGTVPVNCLLETVPESSAEVLERLGFQKRRSFLWMQYTNPGGGV